MSDNEESIFAHALEIESFEQRDAYLSEACGGDIGLRERIDALLRSHKEASGLLNPTAAATVAPPPAIENVNAKIGPYKLLQQIGEGGFGVVYMAEQSKPVRRKVALKIIKPGMDTKEVIARFEAERQALALMDHPNIAKVFDAGATATGRPYFVMELVKGIPLTQFCDENSLSMQQRLELFVAVCHAIQHAHQKGVIHRDLKPSNVMVTIHDNKPVPKVIDFGVSKAISQQLTERTLFTAYGQMIGTPVYMSPEQAQMSGLDIDTRSDIYSLGVMLYELLTGSTPLDAERLRKSGYAEMQRLIREEEAPKPSDRLSTQGGEALARIAKSRSTESNQLNRQIRGDLDWIVMKALDKDRNRRYETANGFAADVQRFLQNEAVVACPPTASYRLRKFINRNRKTVLLAGTVVAALLLAIVGLAVGYLRAEQSSREARTAWQNVSLEQERTQRQRDRAEQQREKADAQRMLAERQRELAESATEKARAAERERTESLTDVYTTLGAAAAKRKEKAQAMLWFANAAKIAPDPERERANRLRARTYSDDMLVPIAAFPHDTTFIGSIEVHKDTQFIITRELGENHTPQLPELGKITLWDIQNSASLKLPNEWLPLQAATWSPGGRNLAIVTQAGEFLEVDFATMKIANRIASEETARLLQYSPSGKWLCSFGKQSVRIWNTETQEDATPELPHPDVVAGVNFSPNEEYLLTSCIDGKARLFAISGKVEPLAEVEHDSRFSNHRQRICHPAIFVDGQSFCVRIGIEASAGMKRIQLHGLGGELLKTLNGRFSATPVYRYGHHNVVARDRRGLVFTDTETDEEFRIETPTNENQFAVAPRGDLFAVTGTGRLELWDLKSFELIDASSAKSRFCNYCTFSRDSNLLCTAERGGLVKVWKRIERNPGQYSVQGSSSFAELSPDGKYFARVGLSQRSSSVQSLEVFDVESSKRVFREGISPGFALFTPWSTLTDGKFTPDGQSIVVAIADHQASRIKNPGQQSGRIAAYRWRKNRSKPSFSVELKSEPRSLDVSQDGKRIVALSADGTVTLIDASTGKVVDRWTAHPPSPANNWYTNNGEIAFTPDCQKIVTWGTENFARFWKVSQSENSTAEESTMREPLLHLQHTGRVLDVQFSPDGKRLATSEWDGEGLRVWDIGSGEQIASMKHPDWVFGIRFSPNGDQIVSSCRDGNARVWDWRSGTLVCPPMTHNNEVHDAAFLKDGKTVVTTCYEGSLGVWETTTGTRLAPPVQISGRPTRLVLSRDCSQVILGGHSSGGRGVSVVDLGFLLRDDPRSTDDLVTVAEFFTGHRVNSAALQRLDNVEVADLYRQAQNSIRAELELKGYQRVPERERAKYAKSMVDIFDVDGDRHLELDEATPWLEYMFAGVDRDSDGRISESELFRHYFREELPKVEGLRYLFEQYSSDDFDFGRSHPSMERMSLHFDSNHDNRLSWEEFAVMMEDARFLRFELMYSFARNRVSVEHATGRQEPTAPMDNGRE